jgi:patatin-related protein
MTKTHQDTSFEIRLGLVLFGGTALAVYMNGVVQELLKLIRASQLKDPDDPYWQLLQAAGAEVQIDVIAGTSAGGLNGLVLAKALAVGSDAMDGLSQLWKTKAQIDLLVQTDEPHAIFSGAVMEQYLREVMEELSAKRNMTLAGMVPVLDLYITATDVLGRKWRRETESGQEITGIRNRYLFHLKKRTRSADGRSYDCNEFLDADPQVQRARDRLLMKLGRATSAFPGALPPMKITRQDCQDARLPHLLAEYTRDEVWFSDGGILVNRPFEPVLKTIFERMADRPVRRVVLYLDPDPDEVPPGESGREPHMLEVAASPFTLPRNEDISIHLDEVQKQNRQRKDLAAAAVELERELAQTATSPRPTTPRSYRELRLRHVFSQLEAAFRATFGTDGEIKDAEIGQLLQAVFEHYGVDRQPAPEHLTRFLTHCDVAYHTRRIHYLLFLVDLYLEGADMARHAGQADQLRQLKHRLWSALEDWRNAGWILANLTQQGDRPSLKDAFAALAAPGGFTDERVAAAVAELDAYLQSVHELAGAGESEAWQAAVQMAEGTAPTAEMPYTLAHLPLVSAGFEDRDVMLFPLVEMGRLSEWDSIQVDRLTPGATPRVRRPGKQKLASEVLGHFGGFLDENWRRNDILWGQLDTAELICDMIGREARLAGVATEGLDAAVEACVAQRHREILKREHLILQADRLEQRYRLDRAQLLEMSKTPPGRVLELMPGLKRFPPAEQQQILEGWQKIAAAATPLPDEWAPEAPSAMDLIEHGPIEVLWDYLAQDHSIGEEGLAQVQKSVLITGVLGALENTVQALDLPAPASNEPLKLIQKISLTVLRPIRWMGRLLLSRGVDQLGAAHRVLHRLKLGFLWGTPLVGVAMFLLHWIGWAKLTWPGWTVACLLAGWPLAVALTDRIYQAAVGVTGLVALTAWAATQTAAVRAAANQGAGLLVGVPAPGFGLPESYRGLAFAGFLVLTAAAAGLMGALGKLPRTVAGPKGIVSLERAGTQANINRIVRSWEEADPHLLKRLHWNLGIDYLFMLGYAPAIALGCLLVSALPGAPWVQATGAALAWLALVAGLLDAVENAALFRAIGQISLAGASNGAARTARTCATVKFVLVGAGLLWFLAALGYRVIA